MNQNLMNRGTLQVMAVSDEARPVSGAKVRITDPVDGSTVGEMTTDSSGQTEIMELPAPSPALSAAESEEKPYASYNVTVFSEGWRTVHIGGVQVFPDSLSLQNADMKKASPGGFNLENIRIGPHTLWGKYPAKIQEEEVKPLPDAEGFVVLPEPVIPETVIVHLGRPQDRTAKNVPISFPDYIKNVASSEIYATWTPETIKANVLAILSFTLNRVYTEWYRGKGYNFTITNSTAFDQAFVPGQTIFASIAQTVDDLFTQYVTKEGITQPLLTQYCDGRRVQCDGLSQWGSQSLGEQGLSAIEILKRYYGAEIYLAQAKKVQGIPRSFDGETLQIGSRGEAVRTIQQQLNRIAVSFPAIPKVAADGIYGRDTSTAVKTFQKIFHLPETGKTDFATWYEISHIYVAVTDIA